MKLLLLTPQLPYPPHQGTTIRNYNLAVRLSERHEVHLLSFVQDEEELEKAGPLRDAVCSVRVVRAPDQRTSADRMRSLVTSKLPDMALRLPSAPFVAELQRALATLRPDVLQVEGIEMAQYALSAAAAPACDRPLIVFDDHNAEYVLQRRAFETDLRRPARWVGAAYSWVQWHRLAAYESHTCSQVDRVVVCSDADREAVRAIVPNVELTIIPNGVDSDYFRPDADFSPLKDMPPNSIVFTGKMDFRPNVDAVVWFANEVLPLIRARLLDARFFIVGQKPNPRVQALAALRGVIVTGPVPDVRPYLAAAGVYVVPLRIGGGTRLKILEAMAMGRPVVSTTVGCEGFPLTSGQQLVMADGPEAFAAAVVEVLQDRAKGERLGAEGRAFVESRYDWKSIVPLFDAVYARR